MTSFTHISLTRYLAMALALAILSAYSAPPGFATEPSSKIIVANQVKESRTSSKNSKSRLTRATVEVTIKAPKEFVWKTLTDFSHYPQIFPKIKSCRVLKREGQLVYLESYIKPQMFVSEQCQQTINDLGSKPDCLRWKMVDGIFRAAEGEWQLKPTNRGKYCLVKYTLEIDPGPTIPKPIAAIVIRLTQKEAVGYVKQAVEKDIQPLTSAKGNLPIPPLEPEG